MYTLLQEFMHWKHPTRIHEHKKATNPPPDIMRYIHERFYEDYLDKYNSEFGMLITISCEVCDLLWLAGDAKNEVPITNLAKIKFPGDKEKENPKCKRVYLLSIMPSFRLIYTL